MTEIQKYATTTNIENKVEKTPFKRWNINRVAKQTFDENPTIRVSGKNISLKEYQNENAMDTNIYDVLEKYHGDLKLTQEALNNKYVAISDEMAQINNLADAYEIKNQAEKVWKELPLEIRREFGYSQDRFAKDGQKFAMKKVTEYNKLQEEIKLKNELALKQQEAQKQLPSGDINNG